MNTPLRVRRRLVSEAGTWPDTVPALLQRIYAARGATCVEQAQPRLANLLPPDGMKGLAEAAALLARHIAARQHIVVVGDFDCDGATACAVAVRGLRLLGATRVSHAVPNRMVHGYGLSPRLVDELAALQPDLLVTVDHGIACHAGIAAARARGWRVLVTDHHLPGPTLPDADVIVDPNQPGCGFASKSLAGVGVMFYVLLALRAHLRAAGAFATGAPDLAQLLDLVAVGTVGDLVPLDANNRALVAAGLRRLRSGQGCAGLNALIEVARREAHALGTADIGYAIAPRINAAGRLEDMALGIECLLTDEPRHARVLAETLDSINSERRAVQQQMTEDAELALSRVALGEGGVPVALCLYDDAWHPGVVGLVASKMKERVHRPVIAFAPGGDNPALLRGSARSIPGFHVRDALADVAARQPGLIERFGGHAMAAGLTLHIENLHAFEQAFRDAAARVLTPELLQPDLLSDGDLAPADFNRPLVERLRDAGTWGQAFPEPLFDGEFEVLAWRVVAERHLKLTVRTHGVREALQAIHFGGWTGTPPAPRVHLAYQLDVDDFRDRGGIQLVVRHCAPA